MSKPISSLHLVLGVCLAGMLFMWFVVGYRVGLMQGEQAAVEEIANGPTRASASAGAPPSLLLVSGQERSPVRQAKHGQRGTSAEKGPAPGEEFPGTTTASRVEDQVYLQVGAFRHEERAQTLTHKLLDAGYPVYQNDQRSHGWYRVYVGPLSRGDSVTEYRNELNKKGLKTIARPFQPPDSEE